MKSSLETPRVTFLVDLFRTTFLGLSLTAFSMFAQAQPAVRLTWWKLDTKELRTITFPVRVLDVVPNPAVALDRQGGEPSPSPAWFVEAALVLCVLVIVSAVLLWNRRSFWAKAFAPFRPRRLAPLNPICDQVQLPRHSAIAPKDSTSLH